MEGIKVGNKKSKYPIIQGGMGVGVSMHNLAGNVSKEGGIGIISTADIGNTCKSRYWISRSRF